MQRLSAASCFLSVLVAAATVPVAAEQVTLQVVSAHMGVRLANADSAHRGRAGTIRCDVTSAGYSREFGFSCLNTADLLSPVAQAQSPDFRFSYDVHVILPDSARVLLHCSSILDAHCEGLPAYSDKDHTAITCSEFVNAGELYKDCTAYPAGSDHIGVYQAAVHGDRVTIYGADWQREYVQYGTWSPEELERQNPAPPAHTPSNSQSPASPSPATKPATPPQTGDGEIIIDPQIIADARAGNAIAQYKLGYDYYLGHGIAQDYAQAAVWWHMAAEQGYADAQNNLGVLYNSGKGVPQSYSEAYFWQNLAAARANGPLQAQFAKNRDESASKLSFFERLRVQKRASRWFSEHPQASARVDAAKAGSAKPDEPKPAETTAPKADQSQPETKPESSQPPHL